MKLSAMAEAFEQQLGSGAHATPRYTVASLENVDFTHPRGLHRQQVISLGSCRWIQDQHNLLITGPTGVGKSFLVCAFVERACGRGFTARYATLSDVTRSRSSKTAPNARRR